MLNPFDSEPESPENLALIFVACLAIGFVLVRLALILFPTLLD